LDGTNALRGGVRGHFFGQSSFASRNLATGRNLVKATKSLSLELLAPLGCGLQTGAGTVMTTLAVCAGSSFAVYGAGSVGLAAVMAAMLYQSQNDHRGVFSSNENHNIAFSCPRQMPDQMLAQIHRRISDWKCLCRMGAKPN
jgi:Zn-dependent alcohol dehydrogenase